MHSRVFDSLVANTNLTASSMSTIASKKIPRKEIAEFLVHIKGEYLVIECMM